MQSEHKVIDLFCGIGGLSHGFVRSGFNVVAGVDNDSACKYGFEQNNKAQFVDGDILDITSDQLNDLYGDVKGMKILVGCAPCQPFSKLNTRGITDKQLQPLEKFAQLISDIQPDIVSMEIVKGLLKNPIFEKFLENLDENGYHYSYQIVNFSDYGVPQNRFRLVLLASKHGEINLIPPTHLHKKKTGNYYRGTVYGRMSWDEPSPTMTTQCTGLGNGRYGHPEQDRAITLREAALFQTFPKSYKFIAPTDQITTSKLARFIGNAVPVRAGEVIAKSIEKHILELNARK